MALVRTDYAVASSTGGHGTGNFAPAGTFVIAANSWVTVCTRAIRQANAGDPSTALTISDSSGKTWTLEKTVGSAAAWSYGMRVWGALFTSGATITFTTGSGGLDMHAYFLEVMAHTGTDTVTPVGASASGTDVDGDGLGTITLSATPAAGSDVIGFMTGIVGAGSGAATQGTDFTNLHGGAEVDWIYYETQTRTGSASTGVTWQDLNSTSNALEAVMMAIEIRAAAAAPTGVAMMGQSCL